MYKKRSILSIIPARSGSKGLPGKNLMNLKGKPLIAHTIEQARGSEYLDRVVVSTESEEIAGISRTFFAEVPFMRPDHLATDTCSIMDVLLHAIEWIKACEGRTYDIVVLLHVTAPLRTTSDIDNCIRLLVDNNADNVFSVAESYRNPYFNMVEVDQEGRVSLVKEGRRLSTRQSAPAVYDMNSSIYVWWNDILVMSKGLFMKNTMIYQMPRSRSVDIDDCLDFRIAEMLLE